MVTARSAYSSANMNKFWYSGVKCLFAANIKPFKQQGGGATAYLQSVSSSGKGEKRGKEPGITAEDLFRDPEMGGRLYAAIMEHSLVRLRGMKKVFFWPAILRGRWTLYRLATDCARASLFFQAAQA